MSHWFPLGTGKSRSLCHSPLDWTVPIQTPVGLSRPYETTKHQRKHRQKEAIYLKYQQGMDYEAIGEAMNISYQSVRNLTHSALSRLKKLLISSWWLVFWDMVL